MGGLAHFLEDEGVPTTQISLIREHTESISPPRALWVPFELGRPLGVPDNDAFQTRVLLEALKLLEVQSGPILVDFQEDAPVAGNDLTGWACPVTFTRDEQDLTDPQKLCMTFKREISQLRPWYDLAIEKRGRTTVGPSGLDPDALGDFIIAFLGGQIPEYPRKDIPVALVLKLAADDLKAFYFESLTAQPGKVPGSEQFANWFWGETIAGKVLFALKQFCMASDDRLVKTVGINLLVPMDQNRF